MEKAKKVIGKFWVGLFLILIYLTIHILRNFGFLFANSLMDDIRVGFWLGLSIILGLDFVEKLLKIVKEFRK